MNQYKKIVLVGMRGSGKSHFGSCLADELGWPKIDMDDEIEDISGKTIPAIIETEGWEKFRDREFFIAEKVSHLQNVVISTGGGAITFERNRKLLKKDALIIFLFASFEDLVERLKNDTTRPSLKNGKSLSEEIEVIWKERGETYFNFADIVFRPHEILKNEQRRNVELNAKILVKKIKEFL